MLKAENITKDYIIKNRGKNIFHKEKVTKHAVKGISLEIEKGKIVGLLGVNGAGKTTTIKMLTTMIEPTSGSITINGIDAEKNNRKVKNIINMISGGERSIYWRLTAKENLEYFGRLYGIKESVMQERITRILDIVDLADVKNTPVEKYSKGMKQRLQIARGLINNPEYVFLDEPTLGLDILIAKELRAYVRKLAVEENKGILLTTHYISEAEELCDYVYVINDGSIISEGTSKEIKSKYIIQYICKFEVDELTMSLLTKINNYNRDIVNLQIDEENNTFKISSKNNYTVEYVHMIEESGVKLLNVSVVEPTLEDAMYSLLGEKIC